MNKYKPRKITAFIGKILAADPKCEIKYDSNRKRLTAYFRSSLAKTDFQEMVDLPIFMKWRAGNHFIIEWECDSIGEEEPHVVKGFEFGRDDAKRARRAVTEQEEDGAALIGGRRHVGSGAIPTLKSDASSDRWQQEAKQTRAKSINLTLKWLDKICREARLQDKAPMLHVRFTDIPEGNVADDDWVLIPAKAFAKMDFVR